MWILLRIGYVVNVFPKLSESFVLNEITTLLDMGHEIEVFSLKHPKDRVEHLEVKKRQLLDRTHYFLSKARTTNVVRLVSNSLQFSGWNGETESLRGKIAVPASKYFSKIASRFNLDIIHAHFNGVPNQLAMLMAKRLKVPFTFTCHAVDIFLKPNFSALRKRMEEAKAILTISYYNREYLHAMTGINRKKIHVVRACPALNKFKGVKRDSNDCLILTVGRLVEKKGIRYAILAFKELWESKQSIRYRIVGTGPLENKLKLMVSSLKLQENVDFLGTLEDDSLLEEYGKASIFVLPCVRAQDGDMDGIPVSLMEAMYCNIPVVSTTISGIPELVENGQEGILVEPRDNNSLFKAIKTLLENKELCSTMGKKGRSKVEREFDPCKQASKLVEIWERT